MRVKEFAALTGVSVRTLHYYDEIGLLAPTERDPHTGFRGYGAEALLRMNEILFFRELGFSLERIRGILDSPEYERAKALKDQRKLIELKIERLKRMAEGIDEAMKGDLNMKKFENDCEKYREEARTRWGNTAAYKEFEERGAGGGAQAQAGMEGLMEGFARCMLAGNEPGSGAAQGLVKELKAFITANFYTCTDEILSGLGKTYTADERFRKNIDRHADGTAEYISRAIELYCGK